MIWEKIPSNTEIYFTAPWVGGHVVYNLEGRGFCLESNPKEYGWYVFERVKRKAKIHAETRIDPLYVEKYQRMDGYLVGNRFIPSSSNGRDIDQAKPVHIIEQGLQRFARIEVFSYSMFSFTKLIYVRELFPIGPEGEIREKFVQRESLEGMKGITPAMELSFRLAVEQRIWREKRQKDYEEKLKKKELEEKLSSSVGRRHMANIDFPKAAEATLKIGGAEYLDSLPGALPGEMVVQFLFQARRFECVVDKHSLQVIDSGICLTNDRTHIRSDSWFTLESLPSVILEAMSSGKLVVYRHI